MHDEAAVAYFFYSFAVTLLLIGAGLRLWQFGMGAALWHDELALARNIVEKPIRELLTAPLDYTQVAPPGFLFLEKAAIMALGNNEYALRLFPLACALISLPLFADFTRRVLAPPAALLALALFSLSPTIIGFGSQVKQYSVDVAMALAMTALTVRWWEREGTSRSASSTVFLGVGGFIAVWFSHTTVLVLVGLGLALFFEALYHKERVYWQQLFPIAILWSGGSLAILILGTHMSASTYAYMQAYWAEGFMPLSANSRADFLWLWQTFRGFFQAQFRYPVPGVAVLLMVLGGVALIQRRRWPGLVVLGPLGVSLVASAARQYPFGDRVSLFLLPFILVLFVEGIDRVRQAALSAWRPLGIIVIVFATSIPIYSLYAFYPAYPEQAIPEVLAYIQTRRQPGDSLYVHHGAMHALAYYGSHYGLPLEAVVEGHCAAPRKVLGELDQFRGNSHLWVIISHVVGPQRERETILGYLDTIGLRRDSIVTLDRTKRHSSSAYLYDLSDPHRLRATSAETYTLPARGRGRDYPCVNDNRVVNRSPSPTR